MSILPALQNELVGAAQRRRDTANPRRRTFLILALASTTITGSAAAAAALTGAIGGPPTQPVPRVQAEEHSGMTRTTNPIVLGQLRFGRTDRSVELIGYRMKGHRGRGSLLCLDLANPNGTKSGGCSADLPPQRNGLIGTLLGPDPGGPSIAVGATRNSPSRVVIHYELAGTRHEATAQLVRVPRSLSSRLQTQPFTYYAVAVPRGATNTKAVARR